MSPFRWWRELTRAAGCDLRSCKWRDRGRPRGQVIAARAAPRVSRFARHGSEGHQSRSVTTRGNLTLGAAHVDLSRGAGEVF